MKSQKLKLEKKLDLDWQTFKFNVTEEFLGHFWQQTAERWQ